MATRPVLSSADAMMQWLNDTSDETPVWVPTPTPQAAKPAQSSSSKLLAAATPAVTNPAPTVAHRAEVPQLFAAPAPAASDAALRAVNHEETLSRSEFWGSFLQGVLELASAMQHRTARAVGNAGRSTTSVYEANRSLIRNDLIKELYECNHTLSGQLKELCLHVAQQQMQPQPQPQPQQQRSTAAVGGKRR